MAISGNVLRFKEITFVKSSLVDNLFGLRSRWYEVKKIQNSLWPMIAEIQIQNVGSILRRSTSTIYKTINMKFDLFFHNYRWNWRMIFDMYLTTLLISYPQVVFGNCFKQLLFFCKSVSLLYTWYLLHYTLHIIRFTLCVMPYTVYVILYMLYITHYTFTSMHASMWNLSKTFDCLSFNALLYKIEIYGSQVEHITIIRFIFY